MDNKRWDIFCTVIDNFGDIGVCWRLARQLTQTYQQSVRLWVDDLQSFQAICPTIDPKQEQQSWQKIEICRWSTPFVPVDPADIVIAAFGCRLPESYLYAMARCSISPVWLNLEYLSAEPWVESCHTLASHHSTLPLKQYFFFPGFTARTGGILYEPDKVRERQRFQQDQTQQNTFWASVSVPPPQAHETRLSLFCYDNLHISTLLHALASSNTPYTCLLPQSPAEKQVAAFFTLSHLHPYTAYQRGNLQLYVLPFLAQEQYDHLLWACDINFVRGEDSFIRAQLAARPFIWHIYPQAANAHHQKLEAFLERYALNHPSIKNLWRAWNGYPLPFKSAWHGFIHDYPNQKQHTCAWLSQLISQPDLAAKLILFCQNKIK